MPPTLGPSRRSISRNESRSSSWRPGSGRSLEAARDGGDWPARLQRGAPAADPASVRSSPLSAWFRRASAMAARVGTARSGVASWALGGFLDSRLDPVERFAGFCEAGELASIEAAASDEQVQHLARAATFALGSLFGFAVAPESLPIVAGLLRPPAGPARPRQLRRGLARRAVRGQLDFARAVCARMEAHPIPDIDMVDVQSLMLIGVSEQALWARDSRRVGRRAGARASAPARPTWPPAASIGTRRRTCASGSSSTASSASSASSSTTTAAPTTTARCSRRTSRAGSWCSTTGRIAARASCQAYDDCLAEHRDDARWIAFIDLDEFLFSPDRPSAAGVLRDYEQWPGVGVNWAMFGPSGHRPGRRGS